MTEPEQTPISKLLPPMAELEPGRGWRPMTNLYYANSAVRNWKAGVHPAAPAAKQADGK